MEWQIGVNRRGNDDSEFWDRLPDTIESKL